MPAAGQPWAHCHVPPHGCLVIRQNSWFWGFDVGGSKVVAKKRLEIHDGKKSFAKTVLGMYRSRGRRGTLTKNDVVTRSLRKMPRYPNIFAFIFS